MLENEGTVGKKRKYSDVKSDLIDALIEAQPGTVVADKKANFVSFCK